jgi:hypothetical protein
MADSWVCGDCRSFNTSRAVRCYRCLVPRKTSEMTAASAAMTTSAKQEERTLAAQVERIGVRYVVTWPLALILIPLIGVATVSTVVELDAFAALFTPYGQVIEDPIRVWAWFQLALISGVSFLLGILVWSIWIARVIANVPALVLRYPHYGWLAAFLGAWVPIINIKRPFSVVREVCSQLVDRPNGAVLIAAAWWFCILMWWFGSKVVFWARVFGGNDPLPFQSELVAEQFALVFYVPAGIFAAGVVFSVERLQRQALKRRKTTILMADGATTA